MKIKAPLKKSTKVILPVRERYRYEVELPADVELIVTCAADLEICAGRVAPNSYRVWPRKRTKV